MDLTSEDTLRLNVLLTQQLQAVRIDETSMVLYGLTDAGEARLALNPDCRNDQYLKKVRECLSNHVLGSPGGYPVYLKRWTRMGQARDESLAQLLKLGEPEAVVAVVHASGLTDELARRAWWAMPIPDNARVMLNSRAVVRGEMGRKLARYLDDYLPFEDDHTAMVETVRLILQPGLLDDGRHASLWKRAQSNNTYLVGFLQARPDDLPLRHGDRADYQECLQVLRSLIDDGNIYANLVKKVLSGTGQAFLSVSQEVLLRPATQDVVISLFEELAAYFGDIRFSAAAADEDFGLVVESAKKVCSVGVAGSPPASEELRKFLDHAPQYRGEVCAMMAMSVLGYPVLRPILSRTTAVGSLMTRKLGPVLEPVLEQIACLHGKHPRSLPGASRRRRRR